MSESGNGRSGWFKGSSPSFLAAVALVVAVPLVYLGWTFLKPNPVAQSENVVRAASSAIAQELAPFRRAVRELSRDAGADAAAVQRARARMDELAGELVDGIENIADEATADVESIEGISLNTQENRLRRIRRLSLEARARIGQLVAEANTALDAPAAPAPAANPPQE